MECIIWKGETLKDLVNPYIIISNFHNENLSYDKQVKDTEHILLFLRVLELE